MDCLRATFSITTPLFLGDAQRGATRFSLQSFKGALRFWWRARAWERRLREAEGDVAKALETLYRDEARIFGKAGEAGEKELGQSRVLLQLEAAALGQPVPQGERIADPFAATSGFWGARYLGYGLMGTFGTRTGRLNRSCFRAGGRFTVALTFRKDLETHECDEVRDALKLLGLLGGLGSRSRRGWGSLALESLEDTNGQTYWSKPKNLEEYQQALKQLIGKPAAPRPPFSAFSVESRIHLLVTGHDPLAVLDAMGRAMVRYRAWGHKRKKDDIHRLPDGSPALQLFEKDHDWAKEPWTGEQNRYVPRRTSFGLPHNYGKKLRNLGVSTTETARRRHGAGDRRASPLLLHVQDLGQGGFAGVATFLPATFTPDDNVGVKWNGGGYDAPVPADWAKTITDWLEGEMPDGEPFFPNRRRLVP